MTDWQKKARIIKTLQENMDDPSKYIKTLTFEDAGKAVRIVIKSLGRKPDLNYNRVYNGDQLPHRVVLWRCDSKEFWKVEANLQNAGIFDFRHSPMGWFSVRMPRDDFASSFYHSDDPKDWHQRNKRKSEVSRILTMERRLDGKNV